MPTKCFFLIPIPRADVVLRRYVSGSTCPGRYGYHNAHVQIEHNIPYDPDPHAFATLPKAKLPNDDPRWPVKCEFCDYFFEDSDERQHNVHQLFQSTADGELVTLNDAGPGAMWRADWLANAGFEYKKDRPMAPLCVRLPNRTDWIIDSKATGGGFWERSGDPPNVTARPSILAGNYHGWLTDGVLSDHLG